MDSMLYIIKKRIFKNQNQHKKKKKKAGKYY